MKFIIPIVVSMLILSCQNSSVQNSKYVMTKSEREHFMDSVKSAVLLHAYFDTVGIENSGVEVSTQIVDLDGGERKELDVYVKNVSGKVIDGIRLKWYGLNIFGEPVDFNSFHVGFDGGEIIKSMKPGESTAYTWIEPKQLKIIVKAWPTQVAFADGTKWKSSVNEKK